MKAKQFIIATTEKSLLRGYGKATSLFAILILSYQIAVSGPFDSIKIINKILNDTTADTNINKIYSGKSSGIEHVKFLINDGDKSMLSGNIVETDTLNLIAEQNKVVVDSMINSYFTGIDDAANSYSIKKSYQWGILFTTLVFSPLLTIIPVAIASAKFPSSRHMHVTDTSRFNNAAYMKGYEYQAHFIKKRELWGALAGGSTVWLAIVSFIL
jgi:hypothetical protein